jgi:hypothetical protein
MGKIMGVLALLLGLTSTAHADRLAASHLDVTFPADWSVFYPEKPSGVVDQVLHNDGVMHGPLLLISRYVPQDDACLAALASIINDNPTSSRPTWAPAAYIDIAITLKPNAQGVPSVAVCLELTDGGALLVMVAPTHGSTYEDATPMLEALAAATEATDVTEPDVEPYVEPTEVAVADYPAESYTTPVPEEPTVAPPEEPASRAPRERSILLGIGGEYLSPTGMVESGYGLAFSLGYQRPLGPVRLELRGLYGVDSSAGFWTDTRAHLSFALFPSDSFTLSVIGGAGLDGIGKSGDPMKVHVPYAPSAQLGARLGIYLDDAVYDAEVVGASRAAGELEPGSSVRASITRRWLSARRLASIGVSYLRFGDAVGRVELIIDFRL